MSTSSEDPSSATLYNYSDAILYFIYFNVKCVSLWLYVFALMVVSWMSYFVDDDTTRHCL